MEEEFHSRNQMVTSHNVQQHFVLSVTLTPELVGLRPEVTVICSGQNLKSNTFQRELKNISLSNGLDNG